MSNFAPAKEVSVTVRYPPSAKTENIVPPVVTLPVPTVNSSLPVHVTFAGSGSSKLPIVTMSFPSAFTLTVPPVSSRRRLNFPASAVPPVKVATAVPSLMFEWSAISVIAAACAEAMLLTRTLLPVTLSRCTPLFVLELPMRGVPLMFKTEVPPTLSVFFPPSTFVTVPPLIVIVLLPLTAVFLPPA